MSNSMFPLGRILATLGALDALDKADVQPQSLLSRHANGDWGCVCEDDKRANDAALIEGSRILSAYVLPTEIKIWIITEATDDKGQREATTLLLPEDY